MVVSADAEASAGATGEGSDAAYAADAEPSARGSCHERTSWVQVVRVIRNPLGYVYKKKPRVLASNLVVASAGFEAVPWSKSKVGLCRCVW